jgi:hypothetical protein
VANSESPHATKHLARASTDALVVRDGPRARDDASTGRVRADHAADDAHDARFIETSPGAR